MGQKQSRYIAFDGIDGAGKSMQVAKLCEKLLKLNHTPIHLTEPTYGKFGCEVRRRIANEEALSVEEQIELFTLDRKQHIKYKINPLLDLIKNNSGFVIVQDRSYYSAPAYQANSKEAMIYLLNEQKSFTPKPDIVIIIDVPVEVAIERIKSRQGDSCLFEKYEFLQKVRENFRFVMQYETEGIAVVDGVKQPDEISKDILNLLNVSPFNPD